MVRRSKWIGSFISLLFVVLFGLVVSPKATALKVTTEVELDRIIIGKGNNRCVINDNIISGASASGECFYQPNSNFTIVQQIYNNTYMNLKQGEFYDFFIAVKGLNLGGFPISWTTATYDYLSVVDFEEVSKDKMEFEYCWKYLNDVNSSVCDDAGNSYSSFYHVTLMANRDVNNVQVGLGYYTTSRSTLFVYQYVLPFNVFMSDISVYKPIKSSSEILQLEQENNEQQGQQSQTDTNQAGQDVEGATTNLLSAITGFFGAFTSASATTCQTDWGIEGFRSFDFCGTQVPSALRVVFTIVASVIFIPMIWFLINSILNAFKEFQQ